MSINMIPAKEQIRILEEELLKANAIALGYEDRLYRIIESLVYERLEENGYKVDSYVYTSYRHSRHGQEKRGTIVWLKTTNGREKYLLTDVNQGWVLIVGFSKSGKPYKEGYESHSYVDFLNWLINNPDTKEHHT